MSIYRHFSHAPWDRRRWPNFNPNEPNLACPCCGEFCLDEASFDHLQALRRKLGRPVHVNSGHRCFRHNAKVGGAPLSMHKRLVAFDVSLVNQRPAELLDAARRVGFTGFGYYATFLHLDLGRARWWITKGGAKIWTGLI
jgi:zinc D-Ala-D-Ala carboxypeptidase